MTREDFFNQCVDVIEHWLNGVRKISDLREVTDKLYNEVTTPRWISVEDELPPRWETNPNVSVPVITFDTLGESSIPFVEIQRYHFGDGRWLYGKATHWMPFQFPEKGEE